MATYPVVNRETGEQKEVQMSVHEWSQWCKDNPDWTRDWSDPSTLPGHGDVGEFQDKLKKLTQVGTMFYTKHRKLQDQLYVLTNLFYASKKEESISSSIWNV